MFKCQVTGRLSQPNEPAHRLVTHIRNRTYYRRNHKTGQDDIIGHGSEVVREILVCREYYDSQIAAGFKPAIVKEKD